MAPHIRNIDDSGARRLPLFVVGRSLLAVLLFVSVTKS